MPSPILSDPTIEYRPQLLADAIREQLDASPSDQVENLPAGTLRIERAWIPFFRLDQMGEIVLSVLSGDDSGQRLGRNFSTVNEIEIGFSVQKKLEQDPSSDLGKLEIAEVVNFAERCLRASFDRFVDSQGTAYAPQHFHRSVVEETLINWNQFTVVWSVTYKTVV